MPRQPKKTDPQPAAVGRRGRKLSPAAQRALAEAEARRVEAERAGQKAGKQVAKEIDGRGGLDPARYGDWEVKGIASDF
jgi:hypothetical protein